MQRGELVQWNDARGFGFIEAEDGRKYFVHISNIGRIATRPRMGDTLTFIPGAGRDGRLEAQSATILGANPKPDLSRMRRGVGTPMRPGWRLPIAVVVLVLILGNLALDRLAWPLALAYAVMGMIAFIAYRNDKRSAESGHWRTSEVTLLGLDLCFGICGGLLGQEIFRHKTRKAGYVATTALICGVHLLWLGGLSLGLIEADEVSALLRELAQTFS